VRTYAAIADLTGAVPLLADDVLEFHMARLLLLFEFAGHGEIQGLTKMAKLDFFLRYPEFFRRISKVGGAPLPGESAMIRYRYGPWDHRYYRLLNLMTANGLVRYEKRGRTYFMSLTDRGRSLAQSLAANDAFHGLARSAAAVGDTLGPMTGSALKQMIYKEFAEEVSERRMGEAIV